MIYVICGLVAIGTQLFSFVLRHDSHSVSFWRGKRLKKLVKDCMATSTFQEMSSVPGYSGNGKL